MQQTSPNWTSPCHTLKSNCANHMASITAEGAWGSKALTVGAHGTEDIMLYCSCLLIPAGRHRLVLAFSLPILKSNSMVNRLLCSLLHSHKICHYALDLRNLVLEDFCADYQTHGISSMALKADPYNQPLPQRWNIQTNGSAHRFCDVQISHWVYQEQLDLNRLLSHGRSATPKSNCQLFCSLPTNCSVEELFV